MTDLPERIRATKAQFRIAAKQYNQAARLLERLKKSLDNLEKKHELKLARAKRKTKPVQRG